MSKLSGVVWALGATQIIGYGTLYYSFSVLAPAIGATFGWSPEWVFGALSLSLLAGGLLAPVAGHLMDRYGAARLMTAGSALAALTLALTSFAPSGLFFAIGLIAMEVASTAVLYAAAFAALVELGDRSAQRSITHLTLIAGFASTVFWPLTALLAEVLSWREIYLIFAALNLLVCLPLHMWISVRTARVRSGKVNETTHASSPPMLVDVLEPERRPLVFGLLLGGFAIEGFLLSGILMHVMPLLGVLDLAASAVLITTLFGPAQVMSRLANMVLGRTLRQTYLGVIAACLLPLGLGTLAGSAPLVAGAVVFAILFGLGSGLTSIVSGSLPLELFGRERYGTRLGWMSSARQLASSVAPFALALLIGAFGATAALLVCTAIGAVSVGLFAAVAWLARVPARGQPAADAEAV